MKEKITHTQMNNKNVKAVYAIERHHSFNFFYFKQFTYSKSSLPKY